MYGRYVLIIGLPVNANLSDTGINQNLPLNLLLKARIKSSPLNLQTAKESSKGTLRVYFASTEG